MSFSQNQIDNMKLTECKLTRPVTKRKRLAEKTNKSSNKKQGAKKQFSDFQMVFSELKNESYINIDAFENEKVDIMNGVVTPPPKIIDITDDDLIEIRSDENIIYGSIRKLWGKRI